MPTQSQVLLCALLAVTLGCGEGDQAPTGGDNLADGLTFIGSDVGQPQQDTSTPDASTQSDTASTGKKLVSLKVLFAGEALAVTERAPVQLERAWSDGTTDKWPGDKDVVWRVNDVIQKTNAPDFSGDTPPKALVWQLKDSTLLAGVSAGAAKIVAEVDGVMSPTLAIEIKQKSPEGVIVATTDAVGTCPLERKLDPAKAIHFSGAQNGAGGLTFKMRLPADTDLSKPLAMKMSTALPSLDVAFADLGGTSFKLAEGQLWFNDDDPLKWDATFVGRTTSLRPIVARFIVERRGLFQIDLLEPAKQLAKSDSLAPNTGVHFSRVSLCAGDLTGGSQGSVATLFARRLTNGLQAALMAWEIDGATGAVITGPIAVHQANAYEGTPDKTVEAFGAIRRAYHPNLTCEVWEGRPKKGADEAQRLWVILRNAQGAPVTAPAAVDDGVCDGKCEPQVVALSSTRFAVLWSPPGGGVRVRRLRGQPKGGKIDWQDAAPTIIGGAKDGVMARHEGNLLIGWYDADQGPGWRRAEDSATSALKFVSAFQPHGAVSTKTPRQGLIAMTLPVAPPNLLFVGNWLDYTPSGTLNSRKINLDGSVLGVPSPLGDSEGQRLWSAAGKPGQQIVVTTAADGAIRARKLKYQTLAEAPQQLGPNVTIRAASAVAATPSMVYLPIADMWLVAWAGQSDSEGVWLRRFR